MCLDVGFAAVLSAAVTGARNAPQQMIVAYCRGIISARKSHHIGPGLGLFKENQYVKVTLSSQTASDCCHSEDSKGLQVAFSSVSQEFTAWSNELSSTKLSCLLEHASGRKHN